MGRATALPRGVAREVERHVPVTAVAIVASLAIHAILIPALWAFTLLRPDVEQTRVLLLEGGLVVEGGGDRSASGTVDEDWEEVLDEQQDGKGAERDEWDRGAVDTSDRERFDAWGIPKPGAFDGREKDDDWDDDWFAKSKGKPSAKSPNPLEVIIDDDLDDEDEDSSSWDDDDEEDGGFDADGDDGEDLDVSGYDIEIEDDEESETAEDVDEQIEKLGGEHKQWDQLFSGGGKDPGKPKALKLPPVGEKQQKSASLDGAIKTFIEKNPYEAGAGGTGVLDGPGPGTTLGEPVNGFDDLLAWIPPDCLMASLISLSGLREREDREDLEKTLGSLKTFKAIAGGVDLSLLDSIDSILIASMDPMDEQETYVILRHGKSEEEIAEVIDARFALAGAKTNWYEMNGRKVAQASPETSDMLPWVYFMPRPGYLAVIHLAHRDRLSLLMSSGQADPTAAGSARIIGDLERHLRMGLVQPEILPGPVVVHDADVQPVVPPAPVSVVLGSVMFGDAFKNLVDGTVFPVPGEVLLTGRLEGDGKVLVQGSAMFLLDGQSEGFISEWNEHVSALEMDPLITLIGASSLIGLPVWSMDGPRRILMDAEVQASDVPRLMALVRLLVAAPEDKLPPEDPGSASKGGAKAGKPKPGTKGSAPTKGAKKTSPVGKSKGKPPTQ